MHFDDGVVRRALRGDRDAFQELIQQAWGVVFLFIGQRVDDSEVARDLTQDTFAQAFEKRATLREGKSLLPWLLAIAANKVIDMRRRRAARPERVMSPDTLPQTAHDDAAHSRLEHGEDAARLNVAIGKLDDLYRTVLILRYWSGLAPGQIARLLEEPEGTIRNRIYRAHIRLRELLDAESATGSPAHAGPTAASPPLGPKENGR